MKSTRAVELAVAAVMIAVLTACASQVPKPEAGATSANPSVPPAPPPQAGATGRQGVPGSSLGSSRGAVIDGRSVYYDFDSYTLKGEYKPVVEANATYLKQHPQASVRIEGNCDERGSREYNLALGQRRADSVRKMLLLTGVPERQVDSTSFGKERPKASGHDEQAWAENRRSDFDFAQR